MRLICELFLAAVLIWFGWEKSFRSWTNQWRGIPDTPPATSSAQARSGSGTAQTSAQPPALTYRRPPPVSTPNGQWMWDPAHRGTLDRPAHKDSEPSQDYKDAGARNYWIDAQGNRHSTVPGAQPPPPSSPAP